MGVYRKSRGLRGMSPYDRVLYSIQISSSTKNKDWNTSISCKQSMKYSGNIPTRGNWQIGLTSTNLVEVPDSQNVQNCSELSSLIAQSLKDGYLIRESPEKNNTLEIGYFKLHSGDEKKWLGLSPYRTPSEDIEHIY